jgi:hypothetical protein
MGKNNLLESAKNYLISIGFIRNGKTFIHKSKELAIALSFQKSTNTSNIYYVNLGYIIPIYVTNPDNIKPELGNIRTRFTFDIENQKMDNIDIEFFTKVGHEEFMKQFKDNIKNFVVPYTTIDSLKKLLDSNPVLLYQTDIRLKKRFGFPVQ